VNQDSQRDETRLPKSLLTGGLRGWYVAALVLAALMLANTLYLLCNRLGKALPEPISGYFAVGEQTIPKLFQVMVLSHTGLGIMVVTMFLLFAVFHLPKVWRRHRRRTVTSGVLFVTAGLVLALTGPFIVYAAASREHGWVWWTHVIAAAVVPLAFILHRSVSYVPAQAVSYRRFGLVMTTVLVAALVGHGFGHRDLQLTPEARLARSRGTETGPGSRLRDLAKLVKGSHEPGYVQTSGFVSESFVPPGSPFFPSAATTSTGDYLPERIITRGDTSAPERLAPDLDKFGFVVNEKIGADTCARCHADIVEQWSRSAHRFASFNNPFYEATINDMRENAVGMNDGVAKHIEAFPQWAGREGKIKSKWCSGCHDPSVMLAGKMTDEVDRRSPQAQAGLTCLACHAIDQIHNRTGNGNYNIADEQEDPYLFAQAKGGTVWAFLHDAAVKAKPDAHKRQMLKPFFRTSEFCGTCHKVSLQEPVNSYRWVRGQNEYDNWHDSGVALNASRTFYLPPAKRVCQDCHMPLEAAPLGDVAAKGGKVRSHRFLAVNTALPFVRGDQETIQRTEAFLRDAKMRIDVFALTRTAEFEFRVASDELKNGTHDPERIIRTQESEAPTETVYALNHTKPPLVAGEDVTLDVVVRNLGVGHTFPGGTNDSNESWIELTLLDDQDRVLMRSGGVGRDGYVDPAAHYFRALMVDEHSRPIHMRNAQDIRTPVYANVIGPGTAHTVHYRTTVPADMAGRQLKIRARLLWRKFDRAYTEFAFETNRPGFKRFDDVPDLPVTEICSNEVVLPVMEADAGPAAARSGATPDPAVLAKDWMRFNDYGIGLILQGDTRAAGAAFAKVAELVPQRVDGPRNQVRVALQEGDLPAAYEHLLRCEEILSNDPQTAFFWGQVLKEDGRYVEAASAFQRVLQKFPEDRATWSDLGRTYYLDGKFEKALEAYRRVLGIDPEDRTAHYHVMLCLRALGREDEARVAEAAYLKFKIDESRDEFTQAYRLAHPYDNRESQPVHVHELSAEGERHLADIGGNAGVIE